MGKHGKRKYVSRTNPGKKEKTNESGSGPAVRSVSVQGRKSVCPASGGALLGSAVLEADEKSGDRSVCRLLVLQQVK